MGLITNSTQVEKKLVNWKINQKKLPRIKQRDRMIENKNIKRMQ